MSVNQKALSEKFFKDSHGKTKKLLAHCLFMTVKKLNISEESSSSESKLCNNKHLQKPQDRGKQKYLSQSNESQSNKTKAPPRLPGEASDPTDFNKHALAKSFCSSCGRMDLLVPIISLPPPL